MSIHCNFLKNDLIDLKSELNKLDIHKLKTTSVETVDAIILIKTANYNTKVEEIEKKIIDHSKNVTTSEFNKLIS